MTSTDRPSRTPPKGRATRQRDSRSSNSWLGPMLQWILLVVVVLVIVGVVLYLGRDVRSTVGLLVATAGSVVGIAASSSA